MPLFKRAAATLPAHDFSRARGFYEQTLGLNSVWESPSGVQYQVGDSSLFVYPSEFAGTNQSTAASFEVDDIDAAVAEIRGRGVTFEEYDLPGLKTEKGIAELDGERAAWFQDTEGNILSVGQRTG
jgi:catechol 2,3-dioxygenase-like lactoylglutathione lyase family enzyme